MSERKTITRHVNRMLLDPNNYRFVDKPEYKPVLDAEVADPKIQLRTMNLLVGKDNGNISDLVASFKTNGFLPLDQIQVKPLGENYLVLEGNRRVATLKYLYEEYQKGNDIGSLTETDFKSVSVVEIGDENPMQHLITMGLHHITGKRRWSPINQAQLISDLIYKYKMPEDQVCDALGSTKHMLRRSLRTLSLIEKYKKSDYGDQFETTMYSLFEEVIKNTNMKNWLYWDDDEMTPTNEANQERLFSWISKTEDINRGEGEEDQIIIQEPIVTKSRDVRELSEYIFDEKALKKMEESRSISEGFTFSDAIGEARLHNALNNIRTEVQMAFNFSEHMGESDYSEITKLRDKLDKLIPSNQGVISINDKSTQLYFPSITKHFSQITISNYRKLNNIRLDHLSRVNIFAGANNVGKTSLLEAFYLLSQLNDINGLLDLEQVRGKFYKEFHSKWFDRNFHNLIELSGVFNDVNASVTIIKEETEEQIDKTNYLSTIKAYATIQQSHLTSSINLFSNREPELYYQKAQILCSASFTSPYRYNGALLRKAHAHAVKERYFDDVVDFIKQHLDDSIEKIEMINIEGESRFMVTTSKLISAIDITKYGEGLQRIFEIALLMCYNKNGILCIDEIDSAIHKSLLVKFTDFIQKSAERFNVQIFLSTHSKECIDAFVENQHNTNDLTAFALSEVDGSIQSKFIEGSRLEILIDSVNLDIR